MSGTRSASPKARVTDPGVAQAALVICAHGIRGSAGVALEHAARIRELGLFREVHACAHKGEPGLAATLGAIDARRIYFAPLLMADAYTLRAILDKLQRAVPPGRELTVCPPIGLHPRLADLMADRARSALRERGWGLEDTALLIVGHGTTRHARSGASAREHAARIAAVERFAEVAVAFLDEPPTIPQALARIAARQIVAEGLFVDRGEHGEEDIPALLASDFRASMYTGPVGCAPEVVSLILEQVAAAEAANRSPLPVGGAGGAA